MPSASLSLYHSVCCCRFTFLLWCFSTVFSQWLSFTTYLPLMKANCAVLPPLIRSYFVSVGNCGGSFTTVLMAKCGWCTVVAADVITAAKLSPLPPSLSFFIFHFHFFNSTFFIFTIFICTVVFVGSVAFSARARCTTGTTFRLSPWVPKKRLCAVHESSHAQL